ncbi:hypothetical protein C2S51_034918 [Perilla frutescens var. frutescens]|nr:hypothetical protein C2S51_034918 [Perilla frutescens var. frutescens]
MSTNCSKLQNSPKEEQGETIKHENPSPNQEIQSEFLENLGNTSDRGDEEGEGNDKFKGGEEKSEAKISTTESEKAVPEEDDDGFKTPTSIEHRIPVITECPPAPSRKRPADSDSKLIWRSSRQVRRLVFVAEAEAEAGSIFTPVRKDNVEEKENGESSTVDDQI